MLSVAKVQGHWGRLHDTDGCLHRPLTKTQRNRYIVTTADVTDRLNVARFPAL